MLSNTNPNDNKSNPKYNSTLNIWKLKFKKHIIIIKKKNIFWTIQNIFLKKQIGIINIKNKKTFNIVKMNNLKNNHSHETELLQLKLTTLKHPHKL